MPYRIEASPNNRAGCKNKECNDQKIKITKGEIRFGTWIETDNFQSWSWRHWGCTTPLVLAHLIKDVFEKDKLTGDENFELIDGWEDLPEKHQEYVREALIQGHVQDDAWKGDPECNRPGMRGFRVAKKKATAKKAATDDETEETKPEATEATKDEAAEVDDDQNVKPAKEVKKASRAKNKKPADDEKAEKGDNEAEDKPVKTKRSARAKKTAADEPAEETTESATSGKANAKAKRAPRVKAAAKPAKEDADAETQPAKRRGRPAKAANATEESTKPATKGTKRKASDDHEQDATTEKPKRGRKKAANE